MKFFRRRAVSYSLIFTDPVFIHQFYKMLVKGLHTPNLMAFLNHFIQHRRLLPSSSKKERILGLLIKIFTAGTKPLLSFFISSFWQMIAFREEANSIRNSFFFSGLTIPKTRWMVSVTLFVWRALSTKCPVLAAVRAEGDNINIQETIVQEGQGSVINNKPEEFSIRENDTPFLPTEKRIENISQDKAVSHREESGSIGLNNPYYAERKLKSMFYRKIISKTT